MHLYLYECDTFALHKFLKALEIALATGPSHATCRWVLSGTSETPVLVIGTTRPVSCLSEEAAASFRRRRRGRLVIGPHGHVAVSNMSEAVGFTTHTYLKMKVRKEQGDGSLYSLKLTILLWRPPRN